MVFLGGEPASSKSWADLLVTGQLLPLLLLYIVNSNSALLESAVLGLYYKQENNYSF